MGTTRIGRIARKHFVKIDITQLLLRIVNPSFMDIPALMERGKLRMTDVQVVCVSRKAFKAQWCEVC